MPLDFSEYNDTWLASKLSGSTGALGDEAIKLMNWILFFGCASEEFRAIIYDLDNWMSKSPLSWANYRALMACDLVALDTCPGMHPVRIGEMLHSAIAKLVIMKVGGSGKYNIWYPPTVRRI